MKIAVISDTHLRKLPMGLDSHVDILIHCGDLTFDGSFQQIREGFKKLSKYTAKHKLFIPGNHDWLFAKDEQWARDIASEFGWITLIDQVFNINNIDIFGTPIQPVFYNWAFNLEDDKRKQYWEAMTQTYDIVVSHCPALNLLDKVEDRNVGCPYLLNYINKYPPQYLLCGHIHESYGEMQYNTTKIINASICDGKYKNVNNPIYFNI